MSGPRYILVRIEKRTEDSITACAAVGSGQHEYTRHISPWAIDYFRGNVQRLEEKAAVQGLINHLYEGGYV